MKSVIYAGIGALALSASSVFAQGQVNQHNVTINLKVTFEGPEQYKETETSSKYTETSKSKFVVGKFSNKEFLEALVEDGLISEIKGWSVVLLVDQDGDEISLFITKKNTSPIDVSDYLSYCPDFVVAEWDDKEVYYSNGDYERTQKWTERGKAKVWLELPYLCTTLRGSYTGKFESTEFDDDSLESKALPEGYFEKSTGGSLDSLVGSGPYDYLDDEEVLAKGSEEEYDDEVLVEGSITLGGAKLVDFYWD
ncbi:MAG TPA: hypothetical protein VM511_11710 [Luteolibacter sp.]|nr:hypothetical protein [Luteolibacter sp.]